jgi:hypothetical protein
MRESAWWLCSAPATQFRNSFQPATENPQLLEHAAHAMPISITLHRSVTAA